MAMMKKRITLANNYSPEERLERAIRARRRFKAVVRLIIANRYWMEEIEEERYTLGDNVMKNVLLITKKKGRKSPLTLQDKALLNTPAEHRTEEDKIKINRAIGGLKCFRRYPADVKAKLAAVTYFVFYGPGHVIVQQHQPAVAMYFLLTGEVNVTQVNYDDVLKENVTTDFGKMGAGTMFGEVALLLDIPRTATITTIAPCELLRINKQDFDVVLKATVWDVWETILQTMDRFTYFKNWDSFSRRECCIMSRNKFYDPDEIVFGGDVGMLNYVYFITKGSCYIVEHLLVEVERGARKKKKYKLYNPNVSPDDAMQKYLKTFEKFTIEDGEEESLVAPEEGRRESIVIVEDNRERRRSSIKSGSIKILAEAPSTTSQVSAFQIKSKSIAEGAKLRTIEIEDTDMPENVETHFVKVCELNEMACFNIGETFKRRHVVAKTNVECLLIPHYWLMQKNRGNIWNKVRYFLDSHIPKTEEIFKDFLEQKKWTVYKKKLVKGLLAGKKLRSNNSIHNVPYSIRIKEMASYE